MELKKKKTREELLEEYADLKKGVDRRSKQLPPQNDFIDKLNKTTLGRLLNTKEAPAEPTLTRTNSNLEQKKEQFSMIASMGVSKKKENYIQLKKWDQQRSQELALHRNTLEELQAQLDKRIKASIENIELYCQFFRDKARQEERFASHSVLDIGAACTQNPIGSNVYINCSSILSLLGEQSQKQARRVQNFANVIRKQILRDCLEQHVSSRQSKLLTVRQKISELKITLQKCNTEAQNKSKKLAASYNENLQASNNLCADQDFYESQLSFFRKAQEQTTVQKQLGLYCLEYLKTVQAEEEQRVCLVNQCLLLYLQAMKEAYKLQIDCSEAEQLQKCEVPAYVAQVYNLQDMLDSRLLELLKQKMNLENRKLTVEDLELYFDDFGFRDFDTRMLLLKEYTLWYQSIKDKSEPCHLVVTVDGYLHVFLNRTSPYAKPNFTFKIREPVFRMKSVSDTKVELRNSEERKGGMMSFIMWDGKTEPAVTLRFQKKDSKVEFCDFLSKLT